MEVSSYKIVFQNGTGEFIEKKSRFIANVYRISGEEEAVAYINAAKKKYWDARHNCYAFITGENDEVQRSSDDGEPSGTAGKPILEMIISNGLHDCLIIVTRYFGGTLLGTGGLIRAYQQACREGINNSIIIEKKKGIRLKVSTDYGGLGKIQYIAEMMGIYIENTEYMENVSISLIMTADKTDGFISKVTEATAAKAAVEVEGEQDFALHSGEIILL